MTDEPIGEGGAANTPPFPRSPHGDPPRQANLDDGGDTDGATEDAAGHTRGDEPLEDEDEELGGEDEPRSDGDLGRERGRPSRATGSAGAAILRRLERTVYHGLGHLADQLEDAAGRIDHLADNRLHALGTRGERAAGAAESAAGWLHGSADYLRSSDLRDLQRDLERQVREKPLQSLLVSAGAGWLLGKIVR